MLIRPRATSTASPSSGAERALSRHRHRRHPQSARPKNGARPALRPQPGSELAHALESASCRGAGRAIKQAAAGFGVVPSTIHRLLNDGIIAGEQLAPRGALAHPTHQRAEGLLQRKCWRGYLLCARRSAPSVSRVKPCCASSGEFDAVHITRGRQQELRVKVVARHGEQLRHP